MSRRAGARFNDALKKANHGVYHGQHKDDAQPIEDAMEDGELQRIVVARDTQPNADRIDCTD